LSTPKLLNYTPVQINVPNEVHAKLKGYAGFQRKRLGDLVNELLKKFAEQINAVQAA